MTDKEIIKALECCTTKGAKCSDCPAFKKVDRSDCKKYFRGAIDLINRQQAEIERLKKKVELPCGIGDNIFYVYRSSQGNNRILKANVFSIVVNIYNDFKKIYLKIIYEDADGYMDRATAIYGVNAFSSREEAELKLKELRK